MDIVVLIIVAIIGVLAGGVVNVLADDLPLRRKPRLPHYPDDENRQFIAWLGLTAFLLGKRTSSQGAKLSIRHPVTEILTAGLMILCVLVAWDKNIATVQLLFWLLFMAIFVLITVIDVEHKLILFVVMRPTAVVAIIYALAVQDATPPTFVDHIIGGIVGFCAFWLLYNGGYLFTYVMGRLRGQQIDEVAFGYGDVMLAGVSGLILGWQSLIFALLITILLGGLGAFVYLAFKALARGRYSAFDAIPYGPYIVVGTITTMLFTTEVIGFFVPSSLT